jgi:hypothetical protein
LNGAAESRSLEHKERERERATTTTMMRETKRTMTSEEVLQFQVTKSLQEEREWRERVERERGERRLDVIERANCCTGDCHPCGRPTIRVAG